MKKFISYLLLSMMMITTPPSFAGEAYYKFDFENPWEDFSEFRYTIDIDWLDYEVMNLYKIEYKPWLNYPSNVYHMNRIQDIFLEKGIQYRLPYSLYLATTSKKCRTLKVECPQLKGLYLPASDQILFNKEAADGKPVYAKFSLLHEYVHAYQYRMRLPTDLTVLYKAYKNGTVQKDEFLSYLSFLYETEAMWYSMPLGGAWERYLNGLRESANNNAALVGMGIMLVNPLLAVAYGFSGIYRQWDNVMSIGDDEIVLPQVDKKFEEEFNQDSMKRKSVRDIYRLHEMPIHKEDRFLIGVWGEFIEHMVSRIENGYYKKLNFVLTDDAKSQRLYTDMHNEFYKNVNAPLSIHKEECSPLFNYLEEGKSPLSQWFNMTQEMLNSCSLFSDVSLEALRFFKKLLLDPKYRSGFKFVDPNHNDPLLPGSEGSDPDIEIHPHSIIQPNLEIIPDED